MQILQSISSQLRRLQQGRFPLEAPRYMHQVSLTIDFSPLRPDTQTYLKHQRPYIGPRRLTSTLYRGMLLLLAASSRAFLSLYFFQAYGPAIPSRNNATPRPTPMPIASGVGAGIDLVSDESGIAVWYFLDGFGVEHD